MTPSKNRNVTVLYPLTTAGDLLRMKFDLIRNAARSGELEVEFASRKPNGALQVLVTADALEAFREKRLQKYDGRDNAYCRRVARRAEKTSIPEGSAPLEDALDERAPRWTAETVAKKRKVARERAKGSS